MKYFIYCRKSSEEESKQVQSLDTQQRMLMDYAQKQNLHIVEVIKESKSARTDKNRPLFSLMLERIENKEADGILVIHTDRLSRNLIEAGEIIKLLENKYLEEVRTPTNIYNTVQSMFYMGFDFLMASHFSRDLSVKVKNGITSKLLKGEFPSYAPIGYVNKDAKIYPDPIRTKYIQKAFKLYNSGEYSLKMISDLLYQEGFRSRASQTKVHKSTINRILKDPIYCGGIRNKGVLYKGIHKPLISKALFDRVNDRLEGKNRSKNHTHNFLYRKFLTCEGCKCKLTASIKKGKYIYYYCTNGKGKCLEHKKYIPEADMERKVKKLISDFTLNKEMADLSLDLYIEDYKKEFDNKVTVKDIVRKQIEQVDKKLDKLLNLHLEESIDNQTFKQKQKALKNEKTELEISLSQKKEENLDTTLELLHGIKKRACSLKELFDCKDNLVRSDLLNSLLWNLGIGNQNILSVQYKLPYAYLKDLNKTDDIEKWRRGRDSNSRSD